MPTLPAHLEQSLSLHPFLCPLHLLVHKTQEADPINHGSQDGENNFLPAADSLTVWTPDNSKSSW